MFTETKTVWRGLPRVPALVVLLAVLITPNSAPSQQRQPAGLATPSPSQVGTQISGQVTKILEGDTLVLMDSNEREREIRIAGIDAPEYRQHYAKQAKRALTKLLLHRFVVVQVEGASEAGSTVGRVFLGEVDVSAALVRQGAVWVDRQYLGDKNLLAAETQARAARIGIWSLPVVQRVAPWVWRDSRQNGFHLQVDDPS